MNADKFLPAWKMSLQKIFMVEVSGFLNLLLSFVCS
jgi:hypothetical protein